MPQQPKLPHLQLVLKGKFRADFGGGGRETPEQVKLNRQNRKGHATLLRNAIDQIKLWARNESDRRHQQGLPLIPAGVGFVMQVPDGIDPDDFAHALGVELVAESNGGYLLVSSADISLKKLHEVLDRFEKELEGGARAASLLEIFQAPDDRHRLERILEEPVLNLWPFPENQEFIFDVSIQTAEGTHSFEIPTVRKRKTESDEEFQKRKETVRMDALANADETWTAKADERCDQLAKLIGFYNGTVLSSIVADAPTSLESAIRFPDSFQVRARMVGKGWTDVIMTLPNIFEVSLPEEIEQPLPPNGVGTGDPVPEFVAPPADAPAVCVVDSGIQEAHLWLAPAIDTQSSRCFLPGRDPAEVSDGFAPGGHGTRVAGAVLYSNQLPRTGRVELPHWIQNARVLDAMKQLPVNLPPARYVEEVVSHFKNTSKKTRLYNHSIGGNVGFTAQRMSTWATKIDELSHNEDVLFIQATGNLLLQNGRPNNPSIFEHYQAGREYPDYLEAPSSRVANPAHSLQALTVGSVTAEFWSGTDKQSVAPWLNSPSAFTRSGFGIWDTVKPDVVEIGGDITILKTRPILPPTIQAETSIELVRRTGNGGPAVSRDDIGTSYATGKVANLAAQLERLFPESPTLLYRGLIVHSARWPTWFSQSGWTADRALRLMGFGVPSLDRAVDNQQHRITLITPLAQTIRNQGLHLYRVAIPQEIRSLAEDVLLRIDVTLSYSSEPRRTRANRRGYLATWLDWRSSGLGEPLDSFQKRMVSGEEKPDRDYSQLDWCLHYSTQHGQAVETHRGTGTIQKDWAYVAAHDLPEELGIAVRGHKGWDHRESSGGANYCLIVSIEAQDIEIPIYSTVTSANVAVETEVVQRVNA